MNLKKALLGLLGINGIVLATTIALTFLFFGIWQMPPNITRTDLTNPAGSSFFLCSNGSTQSTYCPLISINSSSTSANATLNITWATGNGTACTVLFVTPEFVELADFSTNQIYTLPDDFPENSTFGLKITRLSPRVSNCNFAIVPVN